MWPIEAAPELDEATAGQLGAIVAGEPVVDELEDPAAIERSDALIDRALAQPLFVQPLAQMLPRLAAENAARDRNQTLTLPNDGGCTNLDVTVCLVSGCQRPDGPNQCAAPLAGQERSA
jgi:hypothetical protein